MVVECRACMQQVHVKIVPLTRAFDCNQVIHEFFQIIKIWTRI
jgi:hypothetical protein